MSAPPARRSARGADGTLIALHGHGDSPEGTAGWSAAMAPRGWQVEALSSPMDRSGERSWFATGPRGVDPEDLERSLALLRDAVAAASHRGPVVVAGFSQGGALALALGRIDGLEAVVSVCGFLPESDDVEPGVGPPALLVGSRGDEVVPAFLSSDAAEAMVAAGRSAEARTVPGGHEVSPRSASVARRWIEDRLVPRARFSVGLPSERVSAGEEFVSGEGIAEIAGLYETLGFDALYVTDHPAPDDRWLEGGGHQALEPTVALSAAGAATSEILLHTHIYVLGYRNPFLAAKALASLDVVSGGRLVLGVAAGYLRPEFEALGADFAGRGGRLDESLELMQRIWRGESVQVSSDAYTARGATVLPVPIQEPHPPLWIGGNSRAAMTRALTLGQGWSPFPTTGGIDRATRTASIADPGELASRLAVFEELAESLGVGRMPTVCFAPFGGAAYAADPDGSIARLAEECQELFELGVDWLTLAVPGTSRAEVSERASQLAAVLLPTLS